MVVELDASFNIIHLGDAFSCKEAALCGEGIAVDLSLAYCKEDIYRKRLIPVLPGWHRPAWAMTVAIRKEINSPKEIVDFAKWFAKKQKEAYPPRWGPFFEIFRVQP